MKLKPSGTFTVTAAPAPGPITVSFCLTKCDRHELVTLRDLFKDREARCLHLTGAVPLEYVQASRPRPPTTGPPRARSRPRSPATTTLTRPAGPSTPPG